MDGLAMDRDLLIQNLDLFRLVANAISQIAVHSVPSGPKVKMD
jgi:hypothetical protein